MPDGFVKSSYARRARLEEGVYNRLKAQGVMYKTNDVAPTSLSLAPCTLRRLHIKSQFSDDLVRSFVYKARKA